MVSAQDSGLSSGCSLLDAETVGPGHQRAEQQLVVDQDHHQHGEDGLEDGGQVLLRDGDRDLGADAGQGRCWCCPR